MKSLLAIALIAVVTFTAHLWTPLLLERPAMLAFVLSDRFWPAVLGMVLAIAFICAAATAALVFHPGSLTGREPEGGE